MKYQISFISVCVLVLLSSVSIVTPVSADTNITYVMKGGTRELPVAYLGEYVDISAVLGWQQTVAFWYNDPTLKPNTPDIIIDASGNQHHLYLDPAKFKVGVWYRWDGVWERAGNMEAFEIRSGTRPVGVVEVNTTITPSQNDTSSGTSSFTNLIVARGDTVTYRYFNPNATFGGAYIWFFGPEQYLYGEPMIKEGYNYSYTLSEPVTQTFKPGTYPGYIQFINRRQDVFYNKSSISLESPYAAVKSVKVIGMLPPLVKTEFDKLESNTLYTDDTLVSITMELKTPDIQITNYYESNDHIYVRGTSSASEGTNISLVLDPAYSSTTSPALSYTTKLYGTIDKPREYYGIIPVNWNKLSIGTHTLVASIQSSGMKASQQKTVEVTPLHENTAPVINTTAKEIIGDGGWQRIVATNGTVYLQSPNGTLYLIPAPTPITVYVTQPSQTPQIVYVNVTVPQTPTPVPVPTDDIVIPLHPEIAGLAIVIVGAVFVLRRG